MKITLYQGKVNQMKHLGTSTYHSHTKCYSATLTDSPPCPLIPSWSAFVRTNSQTVPRDFFIIKACFQERKQTEVATVGNYGGTSSGTVSIAVHNASLVRPYGPQGTTASCLELHLLLNSSGPTSASVTITVNGGLPGWGVTLAVDIMECPPGFTRMSSLESVSVLLSLKLQHILHCISQYFILS